MIKKKNIPDIRFKGFNEEWNIEKFKTITNINQGLQIAISNRHTKNIDGSYFYITNEFLKKGSETQYYILNPPESCICTEDDVLMTRTGNTGHVVTDIAGAFHNNFFKIEFDTKKINKNYLVFFLRLSKTQRIIMQMAGTSTIPDLNHNDFYRIKMSFPIPKEQTKIGNYFKNFDQLITQHQQKYDKLLTIKKAMLKKMFPQNGATVPEIRFKGFTEDWEEKSLGKYSKFRRGSFPQPYGNKEWYDGKGAMPFVQVVDVKDNLTLANDTKQKISIIAQPKSVFVKKGNVVVTLQGSIGRVAIVQYDVYVDRTLLIFESFEKKTDTRFWAYIIQQKFDIEKEKAPGGTIKTITKEALSSFKIMIPDYEEQKLIGNYFTHLDKIIALDKQKLEKLKTIKKAFLDKMFV